MTSSLIRLPLQDHPPLGQNPLNHITTPPLAEIPNKRQLAAALPLRLLFPDRRPKGEDSQYPEAMQRTLFPIHILLWVSIRQI